MNNVNYKILIERAIVANLRQRSILPTKVENTALLLFILALNLFSLRIYSAY